MYDRHVLRANGIVFAAVVAYKHCVVVFYRSNYMCSATPVSSKLYNLMTALTPIHTQYTRLYTVVHTINYFSLMRMAL